MDKVADTVGSVADSVGQLTNQLERMSLNDQSRKPFYCSNCEQEEHKKNNCPSLNPVAKSNFTRYYPQLPSTQSQYMPPASDDDDDNSGGYDEENNRWTSEFGGVNDATIGALGWKADKPSDFAIKGNSKHITKSLGWFMDIPISIKDKDGKTVTVTENFTRIDNGEPEPMLCLGMTWNRKVQAILDLNKNQFRMKLHGKTYTIPTFSKTPEINDLPKEEQDQVFTDSSSPISEDLKKKVKILKRLLKTEKWLDLALRTRKFFADTCESLYRRDIKITN
ncbi:hypothetical protein F8M41_011710 [Gigaspora margarita]|uniref:CCHC-type domain-containing protein n=1 Tax=Gigaspora margarita TaxID=4874 RepID=A0A8H3X0D9_GIGMA|nr:hypothetical protein F8M41_011710 [Gigaspora margarita]